MKNLGNTLVLGGAMSINDDNIRSSVGKVVEVIAGTEYVCVWFQGSYWKAVVPNRSYILTPGQQVNVSGRVNTVILVVEPLTIDAS